MKLQIANICSFQHRVPQPHQWTGADSEGIRGFSRYPIWLKISFSWKISDKTDKFWMLFLILFFNNSILLPVSVCKIAEWVANSVDPDQPQRRLIWIYTTCSGLSVRIRRINTVIWSNRIPSESILYPPLMNYHSESHIDEIMEFWVKLDWLQSLWLNIYSYNPVW